MATGRSPPRIAEQHSNRVQVLEEGDREDVIDSARSAIRWPTQRWHTARHLARERHQAVQPSAAAMEAFA